MVKSRRPERIPRPCGTRQRVALLLLGALSCALPGCQNNTGAGVLLLQPPPSAAALSDYRPDKPFEPMAANLLARSVFAGTTASGLRVEVRELLVGPRRSTQSTILPTASVLDVRAGMGSVRRTDRTGELRAGSTLALAENEAFVLTNTGDEPLIVTAYSFSAR